MKNIFIVNPMAGQGKGIDNLIERIKSTAKQFGNETEIYITKGIGDAQNFAKSTVMKNPEEPISFFACGGDGTIGEVVNGIMGFDNASVGCIPIGTGNDMVRNFKNCGDFSDIKGQLNGRPVDIDVIRFKGIINGKYQEKYCANMFNIGFDCNVVELAARLKEKPLISGSTAYLMAVIGMMIQKKGIDLRIEEGEEVLADGEMLLCSIANGSYCGGGIYSSPQAEVSDGYFDLNIIKDVSRRSFIKLFPKYQKGTHLEVEGIEKIITVKQCKKLTLIPKESQFFICADGEIDLAEKVEFEIMPKAIKFILPGLF